MVSNLHIPEGEPVVAHDKQGEILREKRKAFTDFHNMGIDSSSAYLGDESSLHKHSGFLSSMAYPAGSAGGKGEAAMYPFVLLCSTRRSRCVVVTCNLWQLIHAAP